MSQAALLLFVLYRKPAFEYCSMANPITSFNYGIHSMNGSIRRDVVYGLRFRLSGVNNHIISVLSGDDGVTVALKRICMQFELKSWEKVGMLPLMLCQACLLTLEMSCHFSWPWKDNPQGMIKLPLKSFDPFHSNYQKQL